MRILIAEDDQVLADGLLRTLRNAGAAVDHVASGSEADAALMTNNEFDLLILDLGLPRMHGLEVLKRLRAGAFIYAIGDNPLTARATGLPTRPIVVLEYVLAAVIGLFAGVVMAASVSSMPTRIFNSTMVYDVVLVVVLGGIGLSGGRGGVLSVIIGTLLIGTMLNGMTMHISRIFGPLVAGTLIAVAGTAWVFLLNAVLSVFAAFMISRWRPAPKADQHCRQQQRERAGSGEAQRERAREREGRERDPRVREGEGRGGRRGGADPPLC